MYQHILVAVDGSPASAGGLAEALKPACVAGGRVRLRHDVGGTASVAWRGHGVGWRPVPEPLSTAVVGATRPAVMSLGLPVGLLLLSMATCVPAQVAQPPWLLREAVAEARGNNPDIQAAKIEHEAARQRISPAGALDDPMLEAGVVNLPVESLRFNREEMTMKMIGLSQRLPYPGKRALRQDVAVKEAEAVLHGYQETVNRVTRDVKIAYFDLALVIESTRLTDNNKRVLEQFLKTAEARYAVGQTSQADVLKAQTQVAKMTDELIKLARERRTTEAELNFALGRKPDLASSVPELPGPQDVMPQIDALRAEAFKTRPQLLALHSSIARSENALQLARKDYLPDFDLRVSYGQRNRSPMGDRREDMVSLTVAINLSVWRESKLDPRVAEASAMRDKAVSLLQAQQNELTARLRQAVANVAQSFMSGRLYETTVLPQARLTVESSLAAYRVNRVDFLTLLDNQMTVLNYEIAHATSVVSQNKALAEIEFITGRTAF